MGQGHGRPPCLSTDGFYLKSERHFCDSSLRAPEAFVTAARAGAPKRHDSRPCSAFGLVGPPWSASAADGEAVVLSLPTAPEQSGAAPGRGAATSAHPRQQRHPP